MLVVQEPKTTAEWQGCVSAANEVGKKVVVLFLGKKRQGFGTDEVAITEAPATQHTPEEKEGQWELDVEGQTDPMVFKRCEGGDNHKSCDPGLEQQFHALASHFKSLVFILVNVDDEDHAVEWDHRDPKDEDRRVSWWDLTTAPGAQLTTTPTLRMFCPGDTSESSETEVDTTTDVTDVDIDAGAIVAGVLGGDKDIEIQSPTQHQLTTLVAKNCEEKEVVDDEEADDDEESAGDNVGGGDLDLYGTYEATSGIGDELRAMVEAMSAGAGVMSALRRLGTMFRISFGHIQIVCWSWSLGWTWPEFVRELAAWVKSWVFFDIVVIVRPECGIPYVTECGDVFGPDPKTCNSGNTTEDTPAEEGGGADDTGAEGAAGQDAGRRLQEPGIIDGFAQTVVRHVNEALSATPAIGRALQDVDEHECTPGSGSRVGYLLDGEFWSPQVAGLGNVTCGDEGYNFTDTGDLQQVRPEGSLVASVTCEPPCVNGSGSNHTVCNALSSDATACTANGCSYTLQSFVFSGCEGVPTYCSAEAGAVLGPIVDGVRVGSEAYRKASAAPITRPSGDVELVSPTGLFTFPNCTDPWTGLPPPPEAVPPEAGPDPLMAIILAAMTVIFALIFVVLLLRCIQVRRMYVGGTRRFLCCLGLLRRDSITCTYLLASIVQAAGYYLGM